MPPPRNCGVCRRNLSVYNRGDYCNQCWGRQSIPWRRKYGKNDAYSPDQDLRREVKERDAIYDDNQSASGDPEKGID